MSRANPTLALPALARRTDAPIILVRSYRLISPLFGGGVEPQQADPVSIVRASEVRGQLRFWWRATRAGRYGPNGLAEMKADEDRLWGSTEGQSQVELEVRVTDRGWLITHLSKDLKSPYLGDPIKSPIAYAAFPLRKTSERPTPGGLLFGVGFDLVVSLPHNVVQRHDVLAALWAWETFGGVGARTRRGFGALHCTGVKGDEGVGPWLPATKEATAVERWLGERFSEFVVPGSGPEGVPRLTANEASKVGSSDRFRQFAAEGRPNNKQRLEQLLRDNELPTEAVDYLLPQLVVWYYPIHRLKQFRQSRRDNGGRPYGRSFWPEPDEIRWRFPKSGFRGKHHTSVSATGKRTDKFPRSVFGLPIRFEFKDNELETTTLQGVDHERLASPLVLRPLVCADGTLVSIASLLDSPRYPPGGLRLKGATQETGINQTPLSQAEANFPPLNGNPDVIRAFLATL